VFQVFWTKDCFINIVDFRFRRTLSATIHEVSSKKIHPLLIAKTPMIPS